MTRARSNAGRVAWSDRLVGVQPRIRWLRSFDRRQHSYQGFVLRVTGTCGQQAGEFAIAERAGAGTYPKVTERVCESPPQYVDRDEEES